MTAHQAYCGEATYVLASGSRKTFRPKGRLRTYEKGARTNPVTRLSSGGLSARLFVGLKVGQRTAYKVDDVIAVVRRVRKRQGKSADASILAQKGIYEDRSGDLIVEPSVQIVIIDLAGEKKPAFVSDMKKLAEELRRKLKQETVILEIQKSGVVKDVYSVTA